MAGHSKWANIKRQKAVVDARRGSIFTQLSRAIIVAARNGIPDPAGNFQLRTAIDKAKAAGIPNDNIDRVIQQAEKRVEENKAKEERIKQIEQEEAEVQKVHDTMYYESMYNQKAKKLNTYNNFLKTQIEEAVSTNVES